MMISHPETPFSSLTVRQLEDLGDAIDQVALTVPGTDHLAATLVELEAEITRRVLGQD
jgi:hypothetical protein